MQRYEFESHLSSQLNALTQMIVVFVAQSLSASGFFAISWDHFVLDGKPFRYVSGSFHYFRGHPNRWDNTLKKMAAGGLNVVQTSVAWNIHEPQKGVYN
jgi:beta-galactosidase